MKSSQMAQLRRQTLNRHARLSLINHTNTMIRNSQIGQGKLVGLQPQVMRQMSHMQPKINQQLRHLQPQPMKQLGNAQPRVGQQMRHMASIVSRRAQQMRQPRQQQQQQQSRQAQQQSKGMAR